MMRILMLAMMLMFSGMTVPASAQEKESAAQPETAMQGPCTIHFEEDFKAFDLNGDGKITLQEMYDMPSYGATQDDLEQMKDTRRQMFRGMNTNKDEYVSKEELLAYEMQMLPNCVIK